MAARLIARLPDSIEFRLSGEPPLVIDGQQFGPMLQWLRSVGRRRCPDGLLRPTIAAGRARYRDDTRAVDDARMAYRWARAHAAALGAEWP